MPFLAPCDCRTALQQPDFWKRLDQAPSGEPSARKAKQAKTRLRAAYDMAPSAASIEIALTVAAKTLKILTKRCVPALLARFAVLSDEAEDGLAERLRLVP